MSCISYERQRNADDSVQKGYYYRASQYRTIDTIRAVDKYTVEIKTKEPVAPFFHFMADTNAMIIPKEIVDNDPGPSWRTSRGTASTQTRGRRPASG